MTMKKNDTEKAEISQVVPSPEVPEVPENLPTSEAPAEAPEDDVPGQEDAPEAEAPKKAVKEASKKRVAAKAETEYPDFLSSYITAYPHNKTFHVTTDRMVFLEGDLGLAIIHQNSLAGGGKVETYKP